MWSRNAGNLRSVRSASIFWPPLGSRSTLAYARVDAGRACAGWGPVEKNDHAAHAPAPTTATTPTAPPTTQAVRRARGDVGGCGGPAGPSRYSGALVTEKA